MKYILLISSIAIIVIAIIFAKSQAPKTTTPAQLTSPKQAAQSITPANSVSLTPGNSDQELNTDTTQIDQDLNDINTQTGEYDQSLSQGSSDNESKITE